MKKFNPYILFLFTCCTGNLLAQQQESTSYQQQLPELILAPERTLHIVSPEPIGYVDISSKQIVGDLPLDNVLRLKLLVDSTQDSPPAALGTVSIIGDTFITQYNLLLASSPEAAGLPTRVNILPPYMSPLDISGISLSHAQIKNKALQILTDRTRSAKPVRKNREFGVTMGVNNLYTVTEYIFMDLSVNNNSNMQYEPDELRFFIEDKKITKSTNVQSIEITPIFALHPLGTFQRNFRNIYVFKKVSFPGNKVLKVSLSEQQISGRTVELKLKYRDILHADTF